MTTTTITLADVQSAEREYMSAAIQALTVVDAGKAIFTHLRDSLPQGPQKVALTLLINRTDKAEARFQAWMDAEEALRGGEGL